LRSLISETLNKKLDEILTMCFLGNRVADRAMSVINVKFVMPKTEKILHEAIAHLFPQLGDLVSTYQAQRNCLSGYGLTPADLTDYTSPQEFFEKMVDYMTDLEALCYDTYVMALEEKDITTLAFVEDFIEEITPVTEQCVLLADKGEAYNGDWQRFDHDINCFVFLTGEVEED
jgi:hypothetical protein